MKNRSTRVNNNGANNGIDLGVDRSLLYTTLVIDTQCHAFVKAHRTLDHNIFKINFQKKKNQTQNVEEKMECRM